jgi:glycosyltransferase involved in cell wall biosynthesis
VSTGEQVLGESAGIRAPYRVIPNGVEVASPTPDRTHARRRLELDDAPLVVCVGRLSRQKGQDVLLDAWPHVRAAIPAARLALVGDGPDRRRLADRASDDVRFVGAVANVGTWIAAADVVAIASRWEGMSFTMLDAMSAGRSVVSTDVSGAPDALRPEAIVEREDAPALAEALARRLRDNELRVEEERTNRSTVEASFDLRTTCERTADLYAELTRR